MPEISGDPSRTTIRSDISVLRWLTCLTIEIGPKRAFPAFAHPKQSFSAIVRLALSLDILTDISGMIERDEEEQKTLDQIELKIDRLIRSAIRAVR